MSSSNFNFFQWIIISSFKKTNSLKYTALTTNNYILHTRPDVIHTSHKMNVLKFYIQSRWLKHSVSILICSYQPTLNYYFLCKNTSMFVSQKSHAVTRTALVDAGVLCSDRTLKLRDLLLLLLLGMLVTKLLHPYHWSFFP